MNRIQISFEPRCSTDDKPVMLEVPNPATALVIAEINAEDGPAEIWDGSRRIARVTRHGKVGETFWKIES